MIFFKRTLAQIILSFSDITNWQDQVYYILFSIMKIAPIAFILSGLSLWFNNNQTFFSFIICTLLINIIIGAWKHKRAGTFKWKIFFWKNIEMWLIIILIYPLLEMLRILAGDNFIGEGFKVLIQISTILYPGSKILKNGYILSNRKFPPGFLMERLYKFEKTGNLNELFEEKR